MRLHTRKCPYNCCKICEKPFTQEGAFTTHMRSHIGKFIIYVKYVKNSSITKVNLFQTRDRFTCKYKEYIYLY